jgi:hypothetical protein
LREGPRMNVHSPDDYGDFHRNALLAAPVHALLVTSFGFRDGRGRGQ